MFTVSTLASCALVCGTDYQHHKDNDHIAFTQMEGYQILSSGLWVAQLDNSQSESESGNHGQSSTSGYHSWGYTSGVDYSYGSSGVGDWGGSSSGDGGGGASCGGAVEEVATAMAETEAPPGGRRMC
ncbi:hypothetical protein BDZ45DRAFT_422908 [Acephala macrosclerotiorum]|nr:hypothetical protein BDZ45DRAFT_422908 [Acephala macrosclerotiorum]